MVLSKSKVQQDLIFNPKLTKFYFSLLYTFWSNLMHTEYKSIKNNKDNFKEYLIISKTWNNI